MRIYQYKWFFTEHGQRIYDDETRYYSSPNLAKERMDEEVESTIYLHKSWVCKSTLCEEETDNCEVFNVSRKYYDREDRKHYRLLAIFKTFDEAAAYAKDHDAYVFGSNYGQPPAEWSFVK